MNLVRVMCFTAAALFSMIVGVGGGVLDAMGGDHPAKAVIAGAAFFGATLTLAVIVLTFLLPAPTTEAPPLGSARIADRAGGRNQAGRGRAL